MIDLRGTTILNKNPEVLSWKSFHELHFKYYYTQLPSMLLFAHIFFMNNTFLYLKTNLFLTLPFFSFSFPQNTRYSYSPLVPLQDPSLSLLPCPMEVGNPSHQSMAPSSFMNQWESRMIFLSNENEDENPYAQWNMRKVPFSNQIRW